MSEKMVDGKCATCGFNNSDFVYCPTCAATTKWEIDRYLDFSNDELSPRDTALLCLSAMRDHFTNDGYEKPDVDCQECLDRAELIREYLMASNPTPSTKAQE